MTALRKKGVNALIGVLIGAVCGVLQLYLLNNLIYAVQAGKAGKVLLYLMLKLLVLSVAFVPVIIFLREELLWCGVGLAAGLVSGAIVVFCIRTYGKGAKKS